MKRNCPETEFPNVAASVIKVCDEGMGTKLFRTLVRKTPGFEPNVIRFSEFITANCVVAGGLLEVGWCLEYLRSWRPTAV